MDLTLFEGLFFIVIGLGMCSAGLPRWVVVIGGVLGIIIGLVMVSGRLF